MAERFHFYRRDQSAGETISEYIAELRRLSTHCEFLDGQFDKDPHLLLDVEIS